MHTLLVEPGSEAEGKTLAEPGFHGRYGGAEIGIFRGRKTTSRIQPARQPQAGGHYHLFYQTILPANWPRCSDEKKNRNDLPE